MGWTKEHRRLKGAEVKAREQLDLLTAKGVAAKDRALQQATEWSAANPLKRKAHTAAKDGKVPFMLPSAMVAMTLFVQRHKRRQTVAIDTDNRRAITWIKRFTPVENLIRKMQALFTAMQYELDERMVAIARMNSFKEHMKALSEVARKQDDPSTVAPMWRVVKCTEEGTFFSSIWQEMVALHGSRLSGSSMVVHKAQFDAFLRTVKPTIIELRISVLRWVQLSISTRCLKTYSDYCCLQVPVVQN